MTMRTILFAAALMLTGCSQIPASEPSPSSSEMPANRDAPGASGPMAVYETLARGASAGENIVYSPTSVAQALGLVHLGAADATKSQIERFLGLPSGEAGPAALAARARELRATEPGVEVRIANSLFLSRDWRFRPAFLDAARRHYLARPQQVDFQRDPAGAANAINAWADEATEGLIPQVVTAESIQRDAAAYLANATFFEADWNRAFTGGEMRPFLFGDGRERPFRLMKNEGAFVSVSRGGWKALRLPYGHGETRFAFDVMMPAQRVAGAAMPSLADIDALAAALGTASPAPLRVWLPRFEAEMRADLIPALRAAGLRLPFDRDRADLSAMVEPGQRRLFIGEAFQVARLQVYESGTKAAAVTMMVPMPVSAPAPFEGTEFVVDRPFAFAIRDLRTGEVLFLGRIADPRPFTPGDRAPSSR